MQIDENTIYFESGDIYDYLFDNRIVTYIKTISDDEYVVVDYVWLKKITDTDEFYRFLQSLKMTHYIENVNDCDDFSKAFYVFARSKFKSEITNKKSPTIGEFFYFKNGDQSSMGHALNIIIVKKGEKLDLVFYEPQLCRIVKLSIEEINSGFFYAF